MSRWPCKDYLRGTCTNSFSEKWHPPECLFCKSESGCRFGEKCSYAHRQVDEQPSQRSKKNGDKSAVAMVKKHGLYDRTVRPFVDEHGYSYEWINGQKPHLIKHWIRIQCDAENSVPIVVPGLSTSSSSSFPFSTSMTPSRQECDHPTSSSSSSASPTTTVLSDSETREREDLSGMDSHPVPVSSSHVEWKDRLDLLTKPTKNPKPNKNADNDLERRDLLNSDIPEWLQEFRENLVDDRVPEHRDSHASSSLEVSLEHTFKRSEDLGKHSVYTNFPKGRNCEICQRTKISRAPRRSRNGGVVPRAENFGDLITADHKVLSEG